MCCWLARRFPGACREAGPREEHTRHYLPGPSLLLLFLSQKPTEGQAGPFTRARAYHPHCFKKNFLALSLKLKLPLGTLLFCMFLPLLVAIPTLLSLVLHSHTQESSEDLGYASLPTSQQDRCAQESAVVPVSF